MTYISFCLPDDGRRCLRFTPRTQRNAEMCENSFLRWRKEIQRDELHRFNVGVGCYMMANRKRNCGNLLGDLKCLTLYDGAYKERRTSSGVKGSSGCLNLTGRFLEESWTAVTVLGAETGDI